ncbi:hypothetical protein FOZ63_004325, partial [Perkinsus olseni]
RFKPRKNKKKMQGLDGLLLPLAGGMLAGALSGGRVVEVVEYMPTVSNVRFEKARENLCWFFQLYVVDKRRAFAGGDSKVYYINVSAAKSLTQDHSCGVKSFQAFRGFSSKAVSPVPFSVFGSDSMMMVTPHLAEVANNGLDVQVVKPGNVTFYFMKRTSAEDKAAPDAKRYDKNSLVSQTLRAADVGELIRSSCENVRITDKWHPENYLAVEKDISETHQHEVRRFTIQKDESSQSVSCTLEEMLALQKMLEVGVPIFGGFTELFSVDDPESLRLEFAAGRGVMRVLLDMHLAGSTMSRSYMQVPIMVTDHNFREGDYYITSRV